ncbi:MAG: MmgE/PrpD family protein [Candidatus Micrarchaeota archaeon]|nr:MmgE/PrpD family protein [Candidatus Micrarchaeota archaeon]
MTIAEEISKYVNSVRFGDLPQSTVRITKDAIIDTFGCAIGASHERPAEIAKKVIPGGPSFPCSIINSGQRSDASCAGFVNGIMARYFDYNDSYEAKEFAHPSDNIMPLLAVAEWQKSSGKEALLAIALAYEMQCRLSDAASLWKRGWDHTSYGLVSVAACSSLLMGLTVEQTAQAINIALNANIAMRQVRAGELSMWKAVSFPNAARNAIFSAMLAADGMTGPAPIFEGEMGFWNQVSGKFPFPTSKFGGNGGSFKINERITKYYPAEIRSQSAITAALKARKKIDSIKQIEKIDILTTESGYKVLGTGPEKWNPMTKETADHSLPYIVCAALIDGKIDNSSYLKSRFRRADIVSLLRRVTVKEKKGLTRIYPSCIANEVVIKLKGGRVIDEEVLYQKGHPKNPMSSGELKEKFEGLTKRYLTHGQMSSLLSELNKFERLKDVACLFEKR